MFPGRCERICHWVPRITVTLLHANYRLNRTEAKLPHWFSFLKGAKECYTRCLLQILVGIWFDSEKRKKKRGEKRGKGRRVEEKLLVRTRKAKMIACFAKIIFLSREKVILHNVLWFLWKRWCANVYHMPTCSFYLLKDFFTTCISWRQGCQRTIVGASSLLLCELRMTLGSITFIVRILTWWATLLG